MARCSPLSRGAVDEGVPEEDIQRLAATHWLQFWLGAAVYDRQLEGCKPSCRHWVHVSGVRPCRPRRMFDQVRASLVVMNLKHDRLTWSSNGRYLLVILVGGQKHSYFRSCAALEMVF